MSIILNALRRSEQERLKATGPRLSVVSDPPPTGKRSRWPVWLLGGLMLLNAALLGGYLLLQQQPRIAAIFEGLAQGFAERSPEVSAARSESHDAIRSAIAEPAPDDAVPSTRTAPLTGPVVARATEAADPLAAEGPEPGPARTATSESTAPPRGSAGVAGLDLSGDRPAEPSGASQPVQADRGPVVAASEPEPVVSAPVEEAAASVPAAAPPAATAPAAQPVAAPSTATAPAAQPAAAPSTAIAPAVQPAAAPPTANAPAAPPAVVAAPSGATGALLAPAVSPRDPEALAGLTGLADGIAPPRTDAPRSDGSLEIDHRPADPNIGPAPASEPEADAAPGVTVAVARPVQDEPAPPQAALPRLRQLPASVVAQLPELRILVHVFDPDPGKRFVITNLGKHLAGSEMERGLRLEDITIDGVVLSYQGTRFRLDRN